MATIVDLKALMRAYPFQVPISTGLVVTGDGEVITAEEALARKAAEEEFETAEEKWSRLAIGAGLPESVVKSINGAVDKLDTIITIVTPILKLIELYISSFSSFSKLISSVISSLQDSIDEFAEDLSNAGVYLNVLVPPAFNKNLNKITLLSKMSSGGYQGFLSRLNVSLNNSADPNRPVFSSNASVGGFIILADAETLDQFYDSVYQLMNFFTFSKLLFPIDTQPPPPRNLRGRCGYFVPAEGGAPKFGIKLDWDAPSVPILRFQVDRGYKKPEKRLVSTPPDELTGKEGLINAVRRMIATNKAEWPFRPKLTFTDDEDFEPVRVTRKITSGSSSYIDFNMDGEDPKHDEYHYGVQSLAGTILSSNRYAIVKIPVRECRSTENTADVIDNGDNSYEFISIGKNLGSWSKMSLSGLAPFIKDIAEFINDLLEKVKGMLEDASDAFVKFVEQIKKKITTYLNIIKIIKLFLERLKSFTFGASVAFLYVKPKKGGVENFMARVKNAKTDPEQPPFSGPTGISAGIVFMFGTPDASSFGELGDDEEKIKESFKKIEKAFKQIVSLIKGS